MTNNEVETPPQDYARTAMGKSHVPGRTLKGENS